MGEIHIPSRINIVLISKERRERKYMDKSVINSNIEDMITEGVHSYSAEDSYVVPKSPVKEKMEEFKDMKLGFMIHWGLYAQLGLIASWGLVDAEAQWSRRIEEYD